MNIGLYQSAASLSALEKWQDAVSQNITSAQTTGYRKRTVEFSAVSAGELQPDPSGRIGHGTGDAALFPEASGGINFSTGETQPTRRDLDVAIQGDGFFEVQMADGTHAYTRNGQFKARSDRTLVTSSDQEVIGASGNPITLLPGDAAVTIRQDGTILQGAATVGKLALQKFSNMNAMVPISGGLFLPAAGDSATPVEKPDLMQGYLEASNVAPLREMVDLVLISRAYEANQKIITTIDQQMEKTLDALG